MLNFPQSYLQIKLNKYKKECPCGLCKPVIVLFGITNTSRGAIIGLKFCTDGDNYLLFSAHEDDVINCSFIPVFSPREFCTVK